MCTVMLHSLVFSNMDSQIIVCNFKLLQSYENTLCTVLHYNSEAMLDRVITHATQYFHDSNLLKVTQDEYFTYMTPPGEVYDKSVISG